MFGPSVCGYKPTMASADFCCPIPAPLDAGSQWQNNRPPKVMRVTFTLIPAASTSTASVQVLGFEDNGLLTHCVRLICDSCSSGQCFAFSFLQIPTRDGHPCRSANRSPCRVDSGLSPPSHPIDTTRIGTAPNRRYAPYLAHHKKTTLKRVVSSISVRVLLLLFLYYQLTGIFITCPAIRLSACSALRARRSDSLTSCFDAIIFMVSFSLI